MKHRISVCDDSADAVLWTVKVVAVFYTSMNFRAFPFDQQLLTIVFRVPENINYTSGHIEYVPSVAGMLGRTSTIIQVQAMFVYIRWVGISSAVVFTSV